MMAQLKQELINVLEVAIARGEKLGYEDDDYIHRLVTLQGESLPDGELIDMLDDRSQG
jgi:hypothetical protein